MGRRALLGQGVVLLAVTALTSAPQPPRPADTAPTEESYLAWLEERSMLRQAREDAQAVSGNPVQWRHPYGRPQPLEAVRHASVWLLDYPGSVIPRPGESVIATWADPGLWDALRELGVDLLHTGPLNRAGAAYRHKSQSRLSSCAGDQRRAGSPAAPAAGQRQARADPARQSRSGIIS